MKELRQLRRLIESLSFRTKKNLTEAAMTPVLAKQVASLLDQLEASWNKAYGDFGDVRLANRDLAATFGISTRVAGGSKTTRDISRDSDESLASSVVKIASRFATSFHNEVVKSAGDLRTKIERVRDLATTVPSLADNELKAAASDMVRDFEENLRTSVSTDLYQMIRGIQRRTEVLQSKYMSPEQVIGKPPGGGGGKPIKGSALPDTDAVRKRANEMLDAIDSFLKKGEVVAGKISDIAAFIESKADEIPDTKEPAPGIEAVPVQTELDAPQQAPQQVPQQVPGAYVPVAPAAPAAEAPVEGKRTRFEWRKLAGDEDPEFSSIL